MRTARLGAIAESLPCDYGDDPVDDAPSFDVVKVSNIDGAGQFHGDFEKRRFREDQIANLLVNEGELLVVKSSGSKANILSGKTAICGPDRAGRAVASNFLLRLRVDEAAAFPRFVWYVLNSAASKAFVKTIVGASTYPNLKWSLYSSHPIPLPPLREQRRNAEVLDRAEALRAKRRAALAQLDTLTQSIFLDMFGDPAKNSKEWRESALKDCTTLIQIGPFGSLLHAEDYVSDGVPLINPTHIQQGTIVLDPNQGVSPRKHAELVRYHLRQGDVVMGRRGEMGRCAIVSAEHDGFICGTGSLFIRPKSQRATALYLSTLLATPSIRQRLERFSLGATLPNLNRGIVENLVIPVPPIALQVTFAQRVNSTQLLEFANLASLADFDALFSSLQYRAFRGEL